MNIYYVVRSCCLECLATTFMNNPGYPRRLIVNADDFGVVPTVIFAVCARV